MLMRLWLLHLLLHLHLHLLCRIDWRSLRCACPPLPVALYLPPARVQEPALEPARL